MFIPPIRITEAIGGKTLGGNLRHSSWTSSKLLVLVNLGFVQRNNRGHYRIIEKE